VNGCGGASDRDERTAATEHEAASPLYREELDRWLVECACGWLAYSPANEEWIARQQALSPKDEKIRSLEAMLAADGEIITELRATLAARDSEIAELRRDNEHAYTAYRELTEGRP
jgi:hypothetical protein